MRERMSKKTNITNIQLLKQSLSKRKGEDIQMYFTYHQKMIEKIDE